MLVLRLRGSLIEIQLGRKNKHHLNIILQSRTILEDSFFILSLPTPGGQTEPIHASLVSRGALPSH